MKKNELFKYLFFIIDFVILVLFKETLHLSAYVSIILSFIVFVILLHIFCFRLHFFQLKINYKKLFVFSIFSLFLTEIIMWVGINIFSINYLASKIYSTCIVLIMFFVFKETILNNRSIIGSLKNFEFNLSFIDFIICIFLGFAFGTSKSYIATGFLEINVEIFIRSLSFIIIFLIFTVLLRKLLNFCIFSNSKVGIINSFFSSKHLIIKCMIFILICWIPIIYSLFPGTFNNDTFSQIQQIINLKNGIFVLSSHHPVFDSLFMGGIILPLVEITKDWHSSMFIYVIIQALVTSFSFSVVIYYVKNKLKLSNFVLLIILLFYSLIPIFAECVQVIGKDALFSWIYVLFYILFIEVVRTKGEFLCKNKNLILFVFISVLVVLSKKIGIYVILPSLIICLLSFKKYYQRFIIMIIVLVIFQCCLIPTTQYFLSVTKSGKQEMFSILFQQTARNVKYNSNSIPFEEKEIINKVLNYDDLPFKYDYIFSDPIKGYIQKGKDTDYLKYIFVWFKQGIRNPITYIDATNAYLSGWFSFTKYRVLTNMKINSQQNFNLIPKNVSVRTKKFAKTTSLIEKYYDFLYIIPLINILLSYGFYAVLIPTFVFTTILINNKNSYLIVTLPLILSVILGCFFAPASINMEGQRYLYPVIYTCPIAIAWCVYVIKTNLKNNGFKKQYNII